MAGYDFIPAPVSEFAAFADNFGVQLSTYASLLDIPSYVYEGFPPLLINFEFNYSMYIVNDSPIWSMLLYSSRQDLESYIRFIVHAYIKIDGVPSYVLYAFRLATPSVEHAPVSLTQSPSSPRNLLVSLSLLTTDVTSQIISAIVLQCNYVRIRPRIVKRCKSLQSLTY